MHIFLTWVFILYTMTVSTLSPILYNSPYIIQLLSLTYLMLPTPSNPALELTMGPAYTFTLTLSDGEITASHNLTSVALNLFSSSFPVVSNHTN